MDCTMEMGLTRGARDGQVGRLTVAVTVVLVAMSLFAAATLASLAAPTGVAPSTGSSVASFTSAQLAASNSVGARQRAYWTTRAADGLQLRNAGQQLHASFTRFGVQMTVPGGHVGLTLAAVGRGTNLRRVSVAAPGANGNRVEYARGSLSEYYANGPLGVEQGLRVKSSPGPRSGPLTFAYRLIGRAALAGGQLRFLSAAGRPLLSYGSLHATDALGRKLTARLRLSGSRLSIEVNDAGAQYPLSIDPLFRVSAPVFSGAYPRLTPAALAMSSSTSVTLSVAALNGNDAPWSTADEGIGQPLHAQVTVTNPQGGVAVTNVTPAAISASPTTAVTATGSATPPTPSGGYTIAPGSSVKFTVPYQVTAAGDGTLSDSVTWRDANGPAGPATGMATVPLGSAVSGTVFNNNCGDTTCSRSGLEGASLLAVGQATDGTAISRTATSLADGTFAIGVPAGSYTVGPTRDSTTVDGTGYDPESAAVTVPAAAPLPGQDFATCALADAQALLRRRIARFARPAASTGVLAHAAATASPSACKSIYTIKVSAKIPQAQIVDPSAEAPYMVSGGGGYNPSTKSRFTQQGFPICFSDAKVHKYTSAGATAEWYTHVQGGPLGSATASFAWNRKTQEVHVVDGPSLTFKRLTRVFHWRIRDHGKTLHGTCKETNPVQLLTLPAGGSDVPGTLSAREFSMITVWGFPFEPTGARYDASTLRHRTAAHIKHLYSYVRSFDQAIERSFGEIPGYKHLPSLARFGIELGASILGGDGIVAAVAKGPALAERFLASATYLPQVLGALKGAISVAHETHHLKTLQEIVAYISGLAASGEYPVMGAVIRGRFLASGYVKLNGGNIPLDSMLGLSVKTTKFPTISLQVSRAADANADPNNPVTNGLLPWASGASKQLDVFNKLSTGPAYVLEDSATEHFADGLHGVHEIHAATSQTPALTKAIENQAEEGTAFDAEASEAALPDCGAFTAIPAVGTTLCYKFNDGKP